MRDWLIRRLGGMTKADHVAFKKDCAEFASLHLVAKSGATLASNEHLRDVEVDGPLVIVGHNASIGYLTIWSEDRPVIHAPWTGRIQLSQVLNLPNNVTPLRRSAPAA